MVVVVVHGVCVVTSGRELLAKGVKNQLAELTVTLYKSVQKRKCWVCDLPLSISSAREGAWGRGERDRVDRGAP